MNSIFTQNFECFLELVWVHVISANSVLLQKIGGRRHASTILLCSSISEEGIGDDFYFSEVELSRTFQNISDKVQILRIIENVMHIDKGMLKKNDNSNGNHDLILLIKMYFLLFLIVVEINLLLKDN